HQFILRQSHFIFSVRWFTHHINISIPC
ncbi:uncharacterized protein METZ01_LOCUS254823, partial [marine metagenome]